MSSFIARSFARRPAVFATSALLLFALVVAACHDESGSAAGGDTAVDALDTAEDPAVDGVSDVDTGADGAPSEATDEPTVDAFGIPEGGWANAIVDSQVPTTVDNGAGQTAGNVASDPEVAIGPPDESLTGIVALGPEPSYIVVDLGAGEAACDGEGGDVLVLEYGLPQGGFPEAYRVAVATEAEGPFESLGEGYGEQWFDLAELGFTSARYVRVESAVPVANIFDGLGSPAYPGPEIDAVGARYPCAGDR